MDHFHVIKLYPTFCSIFFFGVVNLDYLMAPIFVQHSGMLPLSMTEKKDIEAVLRSLPFQGAREGAGLPWDGESFGYWK